MWFQPHSCITENLSFLKYIRLKNTTSHFQKNYLLAAARCSLKFPLGNDAYLLIKHPHFLTDPTLTPDKYIMQFCGFIYTLSPPFCSLVEYNSSISRICSSHAIVLSLSQVKLSSIPYYILFTDFVDTQKLGST